MRVSKPEMLPILPVSRAINIFTLHYWEHLYSVRGTGYEHECLPGTWDPTRVSFGGFPVNVRTWYQVPGSTYRTRNDTYQVHIILDALL